MTQITSHVLDTAAGKPADGIVISLQQQVGDSWKKLGSGETNSDGRVADFTGSNDALPAGIYKLTFQLTEYFARTNTPTFYPHADVTFQIEGNGQHYHVPLLLNPFGFSTYRGS